MLACSISCLFASSARRSIVSPRLKQKSPSGQNFKSTHRPLAVWHWRFHDVGTYPAHAGGHSPRNCHRLAGTQDRWPALALDRPLARPGLGFMVMPFLLVRAAGDIADRIARIENKLAQPPPP